MITKHETKEQAFDGVDTFRLDADYKQVAYSHQIGRNFESHFFTVMHRSGYPRFIHVFCNSKREWMTTNHGAED